MTYVSPTYLCDNCNNEFLFQDLKYTDREGIYKLCLSCAQETKEKELTSTQRSLLIWFYNNKEWQHIDQGNLFHAYGEITGDHFDFSFNEYNQDLSTLMVKGYISLDTELKCFYTITQEGIKILNESIEPIITFQCPRCGDFWWDEGEDEMILNAYLEEHPNGTTLEQVCSACEE